MVQHNGDVLFSGGDADTQDLEYVGVFVCVFVHKLTLTGVKSCNA